MEEIAHFCCNSDAIKVVASLQVGDLTNNNELRQYENANTHFFSLFPRTHYPIFCLGNHDYGYNGQSKQRDSNIPSILFPDKDVIMAPDCPENYLCHIIIEGY